MFCKNCGTQIADGAAACPSCGTSVQQQAAPTQQPAYTQAAPAQQNVYVQNAPAQASTVYPHPNSQGLLCAAFVFNLLATIGCGIFIIPLAWMIPMTVHTWGIYKGRKPNTAGFGVCSLIFVGLIGGILLLCAEKDG